MMIGGKEIVVRYVCPGVALIILVIACCVYFVVNMNKWNRRRESGTMAPGFNSARQSAHLCSAAGASIIWLCSKLVQAVFYLIILLCSDACVLFFILRIRLLSLAAQASVFIRQCSLYVTIPTALTAANLIALIAGCFRHGYC